MTKIAIICPPDLPIPPLEGYGGIQRSAYDFISELNRRRDYEILLYASGDSQISHLDHVKLQTNIQQALWSELVANENFLDKKEQDVAQKAMENANLEQSYRDFISNSLEKENPQIIVVMYDDICLLDKLANGHMSDRLIYSLRNIPSGQKKKEFLRKYPALKVTALSKQHMLDYDNRNISVVPWGVDFDLYDFCEQSLSQSEESPNSSILREWQTEGTDYLVMVGAIGIHKSQSTAIEIAQKTNLRLIIAGTPQDTLTLKKTNYFKNEIVPHLSDKIVYFGNANEQQKIDLMRFAKASVAPFGFEFPKWKEPFGRTMIESMACGTPVIAYRNGSPIDMIKEGLSGYLFDTIEEAVEKVPSLDLLNRYETRKYAERLFNIKRVVDDYEKIFRTIV